MQRPEADGLMGSFEPASGRRPVKVASVLPPPVAKGGPATELQDPRVDGRDEGLGPLDRPGGLVQLDRLAAIVRELPEPLNRVLGFAVLYGKGARTHQVRAELRDEAVE